MEDFKFDINPGNGIATTVRLAGRLMKDDGANAMMEKLEASIERGNVNYIMDLEKLEYMNSSGLNCLVNLLTKSRSKGGDVVLAQLSEKVKSLFIVTKLNTVFTVAASLEEATDNFKNK